MSKFVKYYGADKDGNLFEVEPQGAVVASQTVGDAGPVGADGVLYRPRWDNPLREAKNPPEHLKKLGINYHNAVLWLQSEDPLIRAMATLEIRKAHESMSNKHRFQLMNDIDFGASYNIDNPPEGYEWLNRQQLFGTQASVLRYANDKVVRTVAAQLQAEDPA